MLLLAYRWRALASGEVTRLSAITEDHPLTVDVGGSGIGHAPGARKPSPAPKPTDWPAPLTPIPQLQGIRSLISLHLVPELDSNHDNEEIGRREPV